MERNDLAHRMLALANADRLPEDHELRTLAQTLEETVRGFYAEPHLHDPRINFLPPLALDQI